MSNLPYSTSSLLNGASNNTFTNSTFIIKSDRIAAFDKLEKAASPSAFHSFVGRPQPGKCYPNTRVDLLEGLEKWTGGAALAENLFEAGLRRNCGIEDSEQLRNLPIMWLQGGAGAGKSAVAQTFSERCEDLGHIVASFFFFSTDSTRNDANHLVATLAYQIARGDSHARAHIEAVIHQDPRIFDQDFKKQFASLIVDPILKSRQTPGVVDRHRPFVLIIDGLDECTGGAMQAGIVHAISDALRTLTPIASSTLLHFLICSRPEEPIMRIFCSPSLAGIHTSIDLSSNITAGDDIEIFLKGKFAEIKQTHPHADQIPDSWPSWGNILVLKHNSSGHFIYADTVMKFISGDVRPVLALDAVLGLRASPQRVRQRFAELDVLYHHILSRALHDSQSNIDTICLVLGLLAMENSPASAYHPNTLEQFLNLEDGELDGLFGVMVSLIFVDRWSIRLRHKSFGDFLRDKSRAAQFYREKDALYTYTWDRCCDIISTVASPNTETLLVTIWVHFFTIYSGFIEGTQSHHDLHGLIQRRNISAFLWHNNCGDSNQSRFVVRAFVYFASLIKAGTGEESYQLVEQATGFMVAIMKDLLPYPDRHWVPSHLVALLNCSLSTIQFASYDPEFLVEKNDAVTNFLRAIAVKRSQKFLTLAVKCLADERMGDCRLREEHYAQAFQFLTARLSDTSYFTKHTENVLLMQRGLILKGPERRLQTPFRWRKTKNAVQPYRTTGRAEFLVSHQEFVLRVEKTGLHSVFRALTKRELLFGVRCNMVLQKPQASTLAPRDEDIPLPSRWHGKTKPRSGKRTAVRGYFKASDYKWSSRIYFLPYREVVSFQFRTWPLARWYSERKELASILSCIPGMLEKCPKSDAVAVAARRFRVFHPLARRYPGLTKRVYQAMEEYAVRHGYPPIDKYLGNPLIQGTVISDRTEPGINTTVFIEGQSGRVVAAPPGFMIRILIEYLCLRLFAIFGGLDEIYQLSGRH